MFKYGVISGLYFLVFSPNTGKFGPEITPYLDTFHVVSGKHDNLSANTHAHDMHEHFQTAKDMRKQILLIEIDGTQDEAS